MTYDIEVSSKIHKLIDENLNYLLNHVGGFGNATAAANFLREYEVTLCKLSQNAASYGLCEEVELSKIGIRKIHFPHLKYKIFYHIKNNTVYIDFISHDSQDYLNRII